MGPWRAVASPRSPRQLAHHLLPRKQGSKLSQQSHRSVSSKLDDSMDNLIAASGPCALQQAEAPATFLAGRAPPRAPAFANARGVLAEANEIHSMPLMFCYPQGLLPHNDAGATQGLGKVRALLMHCMLRPANAVLALRARARAARQLLDPKCAPKHPFCMSQCISMYTPDGRCTRLARCRLQCALALTRHAHTRVFLRPSPLPPCARLQSRAAQLASKLALSGKAPGAARPFNPRRAATTAAMRAGSGGMRGAGVQRSQGSFTGGNMYRGLAKAHAHIGASMPLERLHPESPAGGQGRGGKGKPRRRSLLLGVQPTP